MYYVYILKGLRSGKVAHYIGYTHDIDLRLGQHLAGGTPTTKRISNISLLGYFTKETKKEAIILERMIKRNGHINYRVQHPTFCLNNLEDFEELNKNEE